MKGEWFNNKKLEGIDKKNKLICVDDKAIDSTDDALSYADRMLKSGEQVNYCIDNGVITHILSSRRKSKPTVKKEPKVIPVKEKDTYREYQQKVFLECKADTNDKEIAIAFFNLRCSPKHYWELENKRLREQG